MKVEFDGLVNYDMNRLVVFNRPDGSRAGAEMPRWSFDMDRAREAARTAPANSTVYLDGAEKGYDRPEEEP